MSDTTCKISGEYGAELVANTIMFLAGKHNCTTNEVLLNMMANGKTKAQFDELMDIAYAKLGI